MHTQSAHLRIWEIMLKQKDHLWVLLSLGCLTAEGVSVSWTGEEERVLHGWLGLREQSLGERECLREDWRLEGEWSLIESRLWLRSLPSRCRVLPVLSRPDSSIGPLSTGDRSLEWPPGRRWRAVERRVFRRKRLLVLCTGHFSLLQITHHVTLLTANHSF